MRGTAQCNLYRRLKHRFIPARAGNRQSARLPFGIMTVHPRSCGEQTGRLRTLALPPGSSPLVRGTGSGGRQVGAGCRFIPARAGNRSITSKNSSPLAVHPRSCGEQLKWVAMKALLVGSSPLVRGTVFRNIKILGRGRFIPARAGNSPIVPATGAIITVHPRSCGEQSVFSSISPALFGSSPLVRGTEQDARLPEHIRRFIPARAGNRAKQSRPEILMAVHPRSCGEQFSSVKASFSISGSSPLVRGTVCQARPGWPSGRFIPARAGNRYLAAMVQAGQPVHPRSCGEQKTYDKFRNGQNGSSPLVRGTGPAQPPDVPPLRFIPARAGNSMWKARCQGKFPVHPRSCGEQVPQSPFNVSRSGSSPLVRGTAC